MNNLKIDFLKPLLQVVSSLVLLWFWTSQIHAMMPRVGFHFLKFTLRAVSPALPRFHRTSKISSINLFSARSSSGSLYGLQLNDRDLCVFWWRARAPSSCPSVLHFWLRLQLREEMVSLGHLLDSDDSPSPPQTAGSIFRTFFLALSEYLAWCHLHPWIFSPITQGRFIK